VRFYDTKAWKHVRLLALQRDHYVCKWCEAKGVYAKAEEVHHIVRVDKDISKALDLDNLVSLCRECHETTRERGWRRSQNKPKALDVPDGVRVIRID